MGKKVVGLATCAVLLALSFPAGAQHPGKIPRIGFLGAASASGYAPQLEAFRRGLRDLGYVEGKNIILEYRWAEGTYDRLPVLAAELVRLKPDLVLTHGTAGTRAAKRATTTIPIVMAVSGDAVATGLVASLAHPGGNITGSSFFNPELAAKRLELLKEVVPALTRVAVLMNPGNPVNEVSLQAMERTARSLGLELQQVNVGGPEEFNPPSRPSSKGGPAPSPCSTTRCLSLKQGASRTSRPRTGCRRSGLANSPKLGASCRTE